VINAVPTDTDDPYFSDDLMDDQEYPCNDQGRVMEPNGGMMIMVRIILLLSRMKKIMKNRKKKMIPGVTKMRKITTTMLPIQTLSL
jgi:hypothetical protein